MATYAASHGIDASPGSNAGCGLKPRIRAAGRRRIRGITRQQCRVRIETAFKGTDTSDYVASPGSNAGCGLKRFGDRGVVALSSASPGSNAGCGLKHTLWPWPGIVRFASPGSNAGCGLKLMKEIENTNPDEHHPAAMPGAD